MRILALHQSAELYGSDRSFLDAVQGLSSAGHLVKVCLHEHGPLEAKLLEAGAEVVHLPLTKISRSSLAAGQLPTLLKTVVGAHRGLSRVAAEFKPDVVYTNTIAVIDGAFLAGRLRLPHCWHVREIIETPKLVGEAFRWLVRLSADSIIANSSQTAQWLRGPKRWHLPLEVIWNGIAEPDRLVDAVSAKAAARAGLSLNGEDLVVLLAGRLNEWKGHDLLIESLAQLGKLLPREVVVLFAGDAFKGKESVVEELKQLASRFGLLDRIRFLGFVSDMAPIYRASDLSVVPSTRPEPFGRTAVESMLYGLPVIAAAHGGLIEIVENGRSGILFPPGSHQGLAAALQELTRDSELRNAMGQSAMERARKLFGLGTYQNRVRGTLEACVGGLEAGR